MRNLGAAVFAALLLPASVAGHAGGDATLIVPVDSVMPGQSIPIIGADLGSGVNLTLELVQGARTAPLGTVTAGPDGHFNANFQLPTDFPNGYSELIATGDDGTQTSVWILVGPRTEATSPAPDATQWWQDPALWLVSALLAGGGIALAVVTLRSRQNLSGQPAPRSQPVRRKARRR